MSISINTSIVPYKIDLMDKRPVQLDIEIINRSDTQKRVVLELIASNQIGLNNDFTAKEKIETKLLKAGENEKITRDIVPKKYAVKGEEIIAIIATEITVENSGYSYPSKKFRKTITIPLK